MKNTTKFLVASALAVVACATAAPGLAQASSDEPTVGDQITYRFYSDVADNESSNWFDADNDMASFDNTHLPKRLKNGHYYGQQSLTSRSTYQLTAASIQTNGYYAACEVWVNGVEVSEDSATGRYAVAVC
ncbi:MAG: hypothetical protein QM658_03615 [Gordonia sp. (in: high G+C Gram-positive bacteria)]